MAKIATLTDDFATKDTTKWTWSGSPSVSGGQLLVPATSGYANIVTATTYDLTSSSFAVQLAQRAGPGNGTVDTQLVITLDANNIIKMLIEGPTLYFQVTIAGAGSTPGSVTYSATTHAWWRVREAAGTLFYETSPNGTTWTQQASRATPFTVTAVTASLAAGYYGTEPSPGTAIWDNVNLTPGVSGSLGLSGSGTLSATGTPKATGSLALSGGGTLSFSGTPKPTGSLALAGNGTLVLSGGQARSGTLVLSGNGTLVLSGSASGYSGALNLSGSGLLTFTASVPRLIFRTPYVQRRMPISPPLTALINFSVAVLRINGQWVETEYPSEDQINSADLYFVGGYENPVDDATAQTLIAAGYIVTNRPPPADNNSVGTALVDTATVA